MNTKSKFGGMATFAASIAVGCSAAIAIAAAAAISESAPTLRGKPAAAEVMRLDPVVVTVSKARFDAIRVEENALARAGATRKVAHG